jgi:pilus assembly protein CpaE
MLPHINVEVFCVDAQSATVLRSAVADRRMMRTHSTVHMGGIAAAVQLFQAQATPNLLVVETQAAREGLLAELSSLAEVCQPETKVVVIGHVNDVLLYRDLIRQGVSEYLVAPVNQLQFIEAIAALYRDPGAKPIGRVLAFVGAKGGVGSSVIAQNCGWMLAGEHGSDTVIADLDLAFGTVGLNFNQDISTPISDVLSQPERVDAVSIERLLTKVGERLSLFSGPGGVDRDFPVEPPAIDSVLSTMRATVPFAVLDIPSQWAPWVKFALVQSDQVVITVTPELASLRNAKSIIDLLKTARPNDPPPKLVLNQTGIPKRPEISAPDFSKAVGVPVSAVIPFDAQSFGLAQTNGQTVFEVAPKSKAAEALKGLVQQLAGPVVKKATPASHSLLARLSKLRKK